MRDVCKQQDDAWPLDEKASAETMKPYVDAIEIFCQQIIKNEDNKIPDGKYQLDETTYQTLLKLPVAEDFEKA